jgi:TIR domain
MASSNALRVVMPKKPKLVPCKLFISHASEDKRAVALPLARALTRLGHEVWYDEFVLTAGDSLKRSIDRGLADCDLGVVIISKNFFAKHWPQEELAGLSAREMAKGEKHILPVWHNIDADTVRKYSPTLADRVALASSDGIKQVVAGISAAIEARQLASRTMLAEFESPFGGRVSMRMYENYPARVDPKELRKALDQAKMTSLVHTMERALKDTHLKKK